MSSILPSNIKESFYWSKWLTFSASALVMLCAGLSYRSVPLHNGSAVCLDGFAGRAAVSPE